MSGPPGPGGNKSDEPGGNKSDFIRGYDDPLIRIAAGQRQTGFDLRVMGELLPGAFQGASGSVSFRELDRRDPGPEEIRVEADDGFSLFEPETGKEASSVRVLMGIKDGRRRDGIILYMPAVLEGGEKPADEPPRCRTCHTPRKESDGPAGVSDCCKFRHDFGVNLIPR